jgi:hypothetical protein
MKKINHCRIAAFALAIAVSALTALSLTACDIGTISEIAHIHQWGDWIETAAPSCEAEGEEIRVCFFNPDHTETRFTPKAHIWGEWAVAIAPTCTIPGKEYGSAFYAVKPILIPPYPPSTPGVNG